MEKIHAPEQGRGGRSGYATVNAPPPRLDGGVNDIVCKPVLANPLNLRGAQIAEKFYGAGPKCQEITAASVPDRPVRAAADEFRKRVADFFQ